MPVKLNFFFSLSQSGERGNPFFKLETVRWCLENAERANKRSGDLKKSAVAGSASSGNRCISGGGAASTRRQERTSADRHLDFRSLEAKVGETWQVILEDDWSAAEVAGKLRTHHTGVPPAVALMCFGRTSCTK